MTVFPNPARGEIVWRVGDRDVVMRCNWDAAERLRAHYGDTWDQDLIDLIERRHLEEIVPALVIMSGGQVTREEIYEASPPVLQAQEVIMRCTLRAFYGTDAPVDGTIEDADPKQRARWTWWKRLAGRLTGRDYRPTLSRI